MFFIETTFKGNTFFLRGTVWSAYIDNAKMFDSKEAAQAGLDKSKQFNPAECYRKARIIRQTEA
jgi:hypothetical protein